ncbi:MAG: diguanylate cyclase, partial [Noviherbaspirillum sp.]
MNNVVLIITPKAADATSLQKVLAEARDGPFDIKWMKTLSTGLACLHAEGIDIILVDLFLPDSQGIATFDELFRSAPSIPILILASEQEESAAIEAVQRGAQGYLSKGYFENSLVPQALRNIIHRKAVEAALFMEKERSRVILESIGEAVLSTDLSDNVTYLNAVAERMTGWPREEAYGHAFSEVAPIVDATTREIVWAHLRTAVEMAKPVLSAAGVLLLHRHGQETAIEISIAPINDGKDHLTGAVVVLHDATATEAATFMKMTYLAEHDFLTDLPNRLRLNERITHAITLAARHGTQLAVLFLDLDNFKHVNDSYGHTIGDKLLQSVAKRLSSCTRASDTVSRQGGDEFIIVTSQFKRADDVSLAAEKILATVAQPYLVSGRQLHVTASIGVSIYPEDGTDADTLVKNADAAMYHAKKRGRNTFEFFNNEMNLRTIERHAIELHLRHALERNELVLHFQPKISLKNGMITGAEALIRWHHPQRGLMLPDQFVPIAEDCGLIGSIGHWVLREACMQAKRWVDNNLLSGSIAVNVSASEFRTQGFVQGVSDVLHDTGLDANNVQLELTESVLMHN